MKTQTRTIQFTGQLITQIKNVAKKDGRTFAAEVRVLIVEAIAQRAQRKTALK